MKVLIIDDQYEGKASSITKILKEIGVSDVLLVASARDGLRILKSDKIDLLLLDLHIPDSLGEDVDPAGGVKLLKHIELSLGINKPKTVIGITAHEEAYASACDFFKVRGWNLILGNDVEALRVLLQTQCSHLEVSSKNQCDIAVITALRHTELAAVLEWDCSWEEFNLPGRPEIFHRGRVRLLNGDVKRIVAASAPTMGMTSAAILATVMCQEFRPALLLMTGIAAGIKGKAEIGDILVASSSWDWGSGKLTVVGGRQTFLASPVQMQLDPALQSIFTSIAAKRQFLDEIFVGWKKKRPPHDLQLKVGPVATGAVVLEDPDTVALIKSHHRGTVGVEMEAFGVMAAAHYASEPKPKALVIKSVCDFADPLKNDEWQEYAAYTSASLALKFIVNNFK